MAPSSKLGQVTETVATRPRVLMPKEESDYAVAHANQAHYHCYHPLLGICRLSFSLFLGRWKIRLIDEVLGYQTVDDLVKPDQ